MINAYLRPAINKSLTAAGTNLEDACEEVGINYERFVYILNSRPGLVDINELHELATHLGAKVSGWLKACEVELPDWLPTPEPSTITTTTAHAADGNTITLTHEHVTNTDEHLYLIDNREEEPISLTLPQLLALADLIKAAQATLL